LQRDIVEYKVVSSLLDKEAARRQRNWMVIETYYVDCGDLDGTGGIHKGI
jgi:hypothetical protein